MTVALIMIHFVLKSFVICEAVWMICLGERAFVHRHFADSLRNQLKHRMVFLYSSTGYFLSLPFNGSSQNSSRPRRLSTYILTRGLTKVV